MGKIEPFSDNIVFIDTEFSSLDPYQGEILSIGLVKPSGKELYLELEHSGEVDKWVKKHILPTLKGKKHTRAEAARKIKKFVGPKKPYAVAYVNQFDMIYLYKLCGTDENPLNWLPIDFASFLFFQGIAPDAIGKSNRKLFDKIGIDPTHSHNALEDARKLRLIYLKMIYDKKG